MDELGAFAEIVGYATMGTTALHGALRLAFKHTSCLDEEQEGAILDFLGAVLGRLSALNGRKK